MNSQFWTNSFVEVMSHVNKEMGCPNFVILKDDINIQAIVEIIQDIADGTYKCEKYFKKDLSAIPQIYEYPTEAPILKNDIDYNVIYFNVVTPLGERTSINTGGILFEDPFYAVLGAYNFATTGKYFFLPLANNNEDLWSKRGEILANLQAGIYSPEEVFIECVRFIEAEKLVVKMLSIKGSHLELLRKKGMATINMEGELRLFELYAVKDAEE